MTDIRIENRGSFYLFTPLTPYAKEWVEENVDVKPWSWFGGGFAVEHRHAASLVRAIRLDGLAIE